MITKEELLYTVNIHTDKEGYKIKKLSDIFINGNFERYTDEFYYNAAYMVEALLRLVDIDSEEE
jgi:hypothetical protein